MALQTVYLETTIPSYLVASPSRDLVIAAQQQITREWWIAAAIRFKLQVSDYVLDEVARGDTAVASKRQSLMQGLDVLSFSEEVADLTRQYAQRLGLTGDARADLPHFAYAVAYNCDYMMTWNCKHIANGVVIKRLTKLNDEMGRATPVILTPAELLEGVD